ncbi:MAG: archease [Candidatus Micrarchaeota archaeon]
MAYRYLEHKADVLIEATGKSFEKALESAAQAMFDTVAKTAELKRSEKIKLKFKARGMPQLLVGLLTELLVQQEIKEVFWKALKVTRFSEVEDGFEVEAEAVGSPYSPELGLTHVKAVTFHECKVTHEENKWVIRVLLDV